MMKESLIFFALLFVVLAGFFQAFIGMAQVDSDIPVTRLIIQGMANTIMQSPEFDTFQNFAFPFGIILYYVFSFVIMIGTWITFASLLKAQFADWNTSSLEHPHCTLQQCLRGYFWKC
jgi:hypothetical protein